MYKGKTVAVVIPCYNEQLLIRSVVEGLPGFVDRVFCVDDCSKDGTLDVLRVIAEERPGLVRVFSHECNQGVGGARITGYKAAMEEGVELVVAMDGDSQMDPADLPALLDPVAEGHCDFCKGNRLFTGEAWDMIPRLRYFGNSMLSLMTKITSGYWHIVDSQTGYAVISLEALKAMPLDRMYRRYGFPNDLLVALNVYHFRVRDVPVRPVYGVGEVSRMRIAKVIPTISWLLWKRFWWRLGQKYVIRDFHPLVFFYIFGFLFSLAGLALGLREVVARALHGGGLPVSTMVLVALLLISGLQMLLWAMWFDMDYNKELR